MSSFSFYITSSCDGENGYGEFVCLGFWKGKTNGEVQILRTDSTEKLLSFTFLFVDEFLIIEREQKLIL